MSNNLTVTVADASSISNSIHLTETLSKLSELLGRNQIEVVLNSSNEMVLTFVTEDLARKWVDDICTLFKDSIVFTMGVDEQDTLPLVFPEFRVPEPLLQFITYISDGKSVYDGTAWKHTLKEKWCNKFIDKLINLSL